MSEASVDLDQYRATARRWLDANVARRDERAELRSAHEISADQLAQDRALQRVMYEAGYVGIVVPVQYGGLGLSRRHLQVWREESAGYAVPAPGGIASHVTLGIVLPTILAHANETQKREWIPKMLSAEEIWVQLLSEPGAGSDLAGLLTRATADGDAWVLNGTKIWSSGALSADYGICLARTDWNAPKHRGLTMFKVPLRDERVSVRPVREINGSAEFCEEFLDDVIVTDDMVIGEVNAGWPIANAMLAIERSGVAGQIDVAGDGSSQRSLAPDLVELASDHGTLGDKGVRQLIARAHINDYMQGQLAKRVSMAIMAGTANPSLASYIKLGLGLVQPQRAALAMDIAGRSAIAWSASDGGGNAASLNFLNGRIMSIAGGSNQIQRNIISERILGLPREPSVDSDKPFRVVLREAKSWGSKS
ncbi:MAG TPA: acyl-CoA dehydrogenase family protein [Acidimicrobiales bacterium]|nr:acyl-CoA dehydrogenase family protein [Acidimicrobiales bacterium]